MAGHANCINFVKSFNIPMMVVGGGGYTMRNVARTWAFEAGLLNNVVLPLELPYNEYYEYYGPDYKLDVRPSNMYNANSPEFLNKILTYIISNFDNTKHAPSVQMNYTPHDPEDLGDVDEDTPEAYDTKGGSQQARDEMVVAPGEHYDDREPVRNIDEQSNGEKANGQNGNGQYSQNGQNGQNSQNEAGDTKPSLTDEEMKAIEELNQEADKNEDL
jgi:histone deacetylase 1/2